MNPVSEDKRKEAFRLFEDGKFQDSLSLCTAILESGKDPAVEILAATNLFNTGRLEDAEVFFRDLVQKMPDSSYVHSYLAKVLAARGDEGAIAEYATAVHLDPSNQDALRSYAEYLLARRDFRGSVPVLRRLVRAAGMEIDRRNLMRALVGCGEAVEALDTIAEGAVPELSREYLDALVRAGNFRAASDAGARLFAATGDDEVRRTYLDALARHDRAAALDGYAGYVKNAGEHPHAGTLCDYILLLKADQRYGDALAVTRGLLAADRGTAGRLLECELLAETGDRPAALAAYEALIRDELASKNDLPALSRIICRYRRFLQASVEPDDAPFLVPDSP
jgi:Flp pilus assembly protein TadD